MKKKLPIIYSDRYNITFLGLQKLHPFDSEKYGKVYNFLKQTLGIKTYKPFYVKDEALTTVHPSNNLKSLKKSGNIAQIAEMGPLALIPNFILQNKILAPMRYATGGTIKGSDLALKYGWSINLSGGYHHAKKDSGGGFCFFSDIAMAIRHLWEKDSDYKILIVDLDAHQGNGFEEIFKHDKRVSILDIYNEANFPYDYNARKYIDFDVPIKPYTETEKYLSVLNYNLPNAIDISEPDFVLYNAGTDIFKEDPLGHLAISEKGIIQRDEIVFKTVLQKKIPIEMVLSGGYTQKSGMIIGRSVENLLTKVIKSDNKRLSLTKHGISIQ